MILPSEAIAELIRATNMIDPTTPEQLDNIEGNTYDLTLGNLYKIGTSNRIEPMGPISPYKRAEPSNPAIITFIGKETRVIPKPPLLYWTKRGQNQLETTLRPGETFLMETIETVTPPPKIMIEVIRRTSLFRGGAMVDQGWVKPGFSGKLYMLLHLPPDVPKLKIERGAAIASLVFHEVGAGQVMPYAGIWGGDKTGTDGVERAQ